LENKSDKPIAELHVYTNPYAAVAVTQPAGIELQKHDKSAGLRIYKLAQPMAPGTTMDFDFSIERAERGFTYNGMPAPARSDLMKSTLNYNGTFFNSDEMPHFGYNTRFQI